MMLKKNYNPANKAIDIQQDSKSIISSGDISMYEELGLEYALNTQAFLGKNLMQTIKRKRTLGALLFCSEKTYSLKDSLTVVHNINTKRVTDKSRNQENQADSQELEFIEAFKQIIENEESPKPIVKN